jgi:predicted aminopeptidase
MERIVSLFTKNPHLIWYLCLSVFVITFCVIYTYYYKRKANYPQNAKYRKQFKIVHIITSIIVFLFVILTVFI